MYVCVCALQGVRGGYWVVGHCVCGEVDRNSDLMTFA
jgi:hypothetical protein